MCLFFWMNFKTFKLVVSWVKCIQIIVIISRIKKALFKHSSYCFHLHSYEPELFPGLIYRMVKPRIVLLIFVSGKVVLTGNETQTSRHGLYSEITAEEASEQLHLNLSVTLFCSGLCCLSERSHRNGWCSLFKTKRILL